MPALGSYIYKFASFTAERHKNDGAYLFVHSRNRSAAASDLFYLCRKASYSLTAEKLFDQELRHYLCLQIACKNTLKLATMKNFFTVIINFPEIFNQKLE
jgi:hypothetical protein